MDNSQHIGTLGDRITVHGAVENIIGFGAASLYLIRDIDGNQIAVKWTKYQAPTRNVRALVSFETTITGHEVYRDVKRTVVGAGTPFRVCDDHPMLAR